MIGCDKCDEWFHAECFNIKLSEIVDIQSFPFVCPQCLKKSQIEEHKQTNPTLPDNLPENQKDGVDKKRTGKERQKQELFSQKSNNSKQTLAMMPSQISSDSDDLVATEHIHYQKKPSISYAESQYHQDNSISSAAYMSPLVKKTRVVKDHDNTILELKTENDKTIFEIKQLNPKMKQAKVLDNY